MNRADDYDLFIKLDADMVFNTNNAIQKIVGFWFEQNKPDMISLAVHDCIPDTLVMGVHIFSKNCRWDLETHDGLFVDPAPSFPGHRVKTYDAPAPLVNHMPNPSPETAFHYGLHRAIKAFQWNEVFAKPQAYGAFKTLLGIIENYRTTKNDNARLALMGAEAIRLKKIVLKTGEKASKEIIDLPIDFWLSPIRVKIYWGIFVLPRIIPTYFSKKIRKLFN
jgi:hypothetical protein